MIGNKYRYNLIDGSYLITRNLSVLHYNYLNSGQEYTSGDLIKMVIWSVNKLSRDCGITADKVILLHDKWEYHRTKMLSGDYKDNRVYITDEDAAKIEDPEEKKKAEIEAMKNRIKQQAKYKIISELGNYGIASFSKSGFEADDLSYIWSSLLYNSDKKSVITSRDSDWKFWTNPMVDNFRLGKGKLPPELITYDDVMRSEMPENLVGRLSLYDYKSYFDSIEGSHNNMRRTRKDKLKTNDIIEKILNGEDVRDLFDDYDRFKLQYSTFKVENFPEFDKVINMFYYIDKSGKISSAEEFRNFADTNGIGISNSYYQKFTNSLDPSLYE